MTKRSIPLNTISIAAPCSADWNKMTGNDKVRFCSQCNLNVYNLSNMTQDQAEDLIRKTEGRLCVRYYRREDGTILTQNCPVGLEALKKKVARVATALISALLSFGASFGLFSYFAMKKAPQPLMGSVAALPPTNISGNEVAPVNTNNSSTCSINNPEMGKVAVKPSIDSAPGIKMGEVAITPQRGTVTRTEDSLRKAAILSPEPAIPPISMVQGAKFSTDVEVEVEINSEGNVINAKAISGHAIVKETAVDAAYQWKFDPKVLASDKANVKGILTFKFRM
jgi:hypothetical protein